MELRTAEGLKVKDQRVTGYAAVYDAVADLGAFKEVIRKGAFSNALKSGGNIRALGFHDDNALLGTTKAGTLSLREDEKGLFFDLLLPDTTHGRDIAELVARGDISGCSFGFIPVEEIWDGELRELLDLELIEITLTPNPAYTDTSVALRSKINRRKSVQRLWLDTVL